MKFTRMATALGLSGVIDILGITVMEYHGEDKRKLVVLEVITSKDKVGRCNIEIPKEDVPALIEKLKLFV